MIRVGLSVSVVQGGRSGIASYVFGLLEGFRRVAAPQKLVLFGLEKDRSLFTSWLDRCEWVPVDERWRPAVRNVFWHQTYFRSELKRHRIDVLHIPSYRRIVWQPPCPQVVTVHDLAAFAVRGKYDWARMIYGQFVVRSLARQADIVSTVSHATASDLEKYFGLPRAGIPVLWNGIDHDRYHVPSPAELESALARLGQKNPYWIYLARLEHPGKNHVRLIEAFEEFCRTHPSLQHELVLGGADWHGAETIHARVAASPVRARIRTLGFVDREDLPFWYAGAVALVYPSLFEGFGLPLIEAMACGCPVITSDRGSLAEVAGGAARLVNPESAVDLAQSLNELAHTPSVRHEWRERGLVRAQEFRWERVAESMTQLYNRALSATVSR